MLSKKHSLVYYIVALVILMMIHTMDWWTGVIILPNLHVHFSGLKGHLIVYGYVYLATESHAFESLVSHSNSQTVLNIQY